MGCGHHGHARGSCRNEWSHHGHGGAFGNAPAHDSETGCGCHRDNPRECCGASEEARGLQRRFHSKEERLAILEQYREDLQKELKAVEEHIGEMRSGT